MLSTTLIIGAVSVLASVVDASPCKPSSITTIVTTTETTSAGFSSETGTLSSSVETTTTADTSSSTGVPTTTAEGPLLTNAGFDDGTTAPWELISPRDDMLILGNAFDGPASGKVEFGIQNGQQYSNLILQKINKKALKEGSYSLEGRTRVDYFSEDGDGCSTIITACVRGSVGNFIPIRDSVKREIAEESVGDWHSSATTCTITKAMLDDDADINVVFGFNCANAGAYLDSVDFKPIGDAEATAVFSSDTTTIASSSDITTMMTTTAATTDGLTTVPEATSTTTTEDAGPTPLLINANFDLDTTEPWLSEDDQLTQPIAIGSYQPYQGPAYGKLNFGSDQGESYNNDIYQKVDTQLLKASSYQLAGFVRVDIASQNQFTDGCNAMAIMCTLGDPNSLNRVPGSVRTVSADSAEGEWTLLDTTCTFTEEMLSQYDYITVAFGFSCINAEANLDAVTFEQVL
ncbi:hypothetical protein EDB82DRAFT_568926 [Fusarium venenatum]|uniref:uncharacterized protein n=1 Tax=Fusarium venenatum TaxID=56646 RepID=UPI001DC26F30|nr:hypothetical protein EDB82DRAFT_568926 [Fusarium venenatum]